MEINYQMTEIPQTNLLFYDFKQKLTLNAVEAMATEQIGIIFKPDLKFFSKNNQFDELRRKRQLHTT